MKALMIAVSFVGSVALPATAQATPLSTHGQAPGYYRMMLGDFEVTALLDGTVMLPLHKVMQGVEPGELQHLLRAGFRSSTAEVSINAYLVNTGHHLILVDAGGGSFLGKRGGGQLLSNLVAAGYRPEDVDTILITHMHGDHLAGLVVDGKMAFPNATIWAQRPELDFWSAPENLSRVPAGWRFWFGRALGILTLYRDAGKLKALDAMGGVLHGVTAAPAAGHTPGHSLFTFESRGQRLTIAGDIAHVPEVQLADPKAHITFDLDPTAAIKQREHFLADAAANRSLVALSHFSFPGIGHVRALASGTFEWVPVFFRPPNRSETGPK